MEDVQTQLTIATVIIGGVGAFATAWATLVIGRSRSRHNRQKLRLLAKSKVQVVALTEQKIEIAKQKIDLEHHENIINGYKDLLVQRQEAIDWVRREVVELRELVNKLRLEHANEVAALKQQISDSNIEKTALRVELNEVRARLQALESVPHTVSVVVETPQPAVAI